MIPITRTTEPPSLAKNKAVWLCELQQAIADYNLTSTEEARKKAKEEITKKQSKYRNKEIKKTLTVMQHGKCAYCESQIMTIGYGCIEHFRPKSKFPNLCFDWDNLLLACDLCNSTAHKGAKFPTAAQGGSYVNPCIDNPNDFFKFVYDPTTKLASVIPIDNNIRAVITEKDLGLNRPILLKHRSQIIRKMVFVAIRASQGDEEAITIMKEDISNESEYAAFARILARKFNI